jgi:hypothetical protein
MHFAVKSSFVLFCLVAALFACTPPDQTQTQIPTPTGLSNEIVINGVPYPIIIANIYYYSDKRWLDLYFLDGVDIYWIELGYINQSAQIPVGTWSALNTTDFRPEPEYIVNRSNNGYFRFRGFDLDG